MPDLPSNSEFKPSLLPRKAEWLSWSLAALLLVTWWILQSSGSPFSSAAVFLLVFLVFAAMGTSLGNWMDRSTVLQMNADGLHFENGLRNVDLAWSDVETVRVLPATAGAKRVQVIGARSHFEFRTLAELNVGGEVKGRSGFEDGDQILHTILKNAGLTSLTSAANVTYYARE